jgi:serine/threonine protein kinase
MQSQLDFFSLVHAVAVIHGDLTGVSSCLNVGTQALMCPHQNNILIDSDGRALVTDIGLSTMLDDITESDFDSSSAGALHWTAPELSAKRNKDRLPTSKSDVWSFGCIMIHVSTSTHPY